MKKIIALLIAVLCVLSLAACSNSNDSGNGEENGKKEISVACSPTPHAIILEKAKELLKEKGWELKIVQFEDYVQPVEVVESGEIDCNYFAHTPYLNNYNDEHKTSQTVVAGIHYEPFGIYSGTKNSLDDLQDGDVIFVPNDGTNETRALLLLQDNGIITLPEETNASSLVTAIDIVDKKVNVEIKEVEAATVSRYRDQGALVILNGNYALSAGLSVSKDAIAFEASDSSAAETYVNVVSVKAGNENNEGIKALIEVLQSAEIVDFINETWDGSVVPFKK